MAKSRKGTDLAPWKSTEGVYHEGAVEVVAEGIKIHWNKLHPPGRVYQADYAWLRPRRGAIFIYFGQENLDKQQSLRTRLAIRYPCENFLRHFWTNTREFHQKIRGLPDWPATERRDDLKPETWKAERDHSETANFEFIARVGSDAVMDFYYIAPSGLARLAQGMGAAGIRVEPVVRIQTARSELLYLLDSAESIAADLEGHVPEELRDDDHE